MTEELVVIRPPSEAYSFLLPVTIGCSHNQCAFCGSYKGIRFRILPLEETLSYIDQVAARHSNVVTRVFLENGDALIIPQAQLLAVMEHLREKFPRLERVGTYATPKSVLRKTPEELKELEQLGLKIAYLGVETGDEELLRKINKGVTRAQMVTAGRKLKEAGIITSVTVIMGLGGVEQSEQHVRGTAQILTEIDPDYAGALTLNLHEDTPLYREWQEGKFTPLSPFQTLEELRYVIAHAEFTDCFFTANHASNYLPLKAHLPEQKEAVLRLLDGVIKDKDVSRLRPDWLRAL
ncbi:MAG: radical SAM protein [Chloroflexota bacterium]